MLKFFAISIFVHAAFLFFFGLSLCPWAERWCPVSKRADPQVEVLVEMVRIGSPSRAGELRPLAAKKAKADLTKQSLNPGASTKRTEPSGADEEQVQKIPEVRISKDDGGDGTSMSVEQYMRWSVQQNVAPVYPRLAQLRGEEGRAIVEVLVEGSGGRLLSAALVESSGSELLDSVSLSTVQKWRFARFEGSEREIRFRIPFRFSLK